MNFSHSNNKTGFTDITSSFLSRAGVHEHLPMEEKYNILQAALAVSTEQICVLDPDLRYLLATPAIQQARGMSMEQLIGTPVQDLCGDETLNASIKESLERAFTGENVTDRPNFDQQDAVDNKQQILNYMITPWKQPDGTIPAVVVRLIDQPASEYDHNEIQATRRNLFGSDGEFEGCRGTGTDITEVKGKETGAELSKDMFIRAIDHFPGGFVLLDKDQNIITYNLHFRQMHDDLPILSEPDLPYRRFLEHLVDHSNIKAAAGREAEWVEERMCQPFGYEASEIQEIRERYYRTTVIDLPDGTILRTSTDITELKIREQALQEQKKRFQDIAETAADWFWETDQNGSITYLSERFLDLTDINPGHVIGHSCDDVFTPKFKDENEKVAFENAIYESKPFTDICIMLCVGNLNIVGDRYFLVSGKPIYGPDGETQGYRGAGQDITKARELEEELQYQANHDTLTGLINRDQFTRTLDMACRQTTTTNGVFVLAYVDLDQFKVINDTAGHQAGDQLLIQASRIINSCIQTDDCLGRLGGDEFGILLHRPTVNAAERDCTEIIEALTAHQFNWESQTFTIGASIGLAPLEPGHSTVVDLLSIADLACYTAKDNGRSRVHIYSPTDAELCNRRSELHMVSGINKAMEDGRFLLYSQPIVELTEQGQVLSHFEILLRMKTTDGDLVPPGAFIPAAERFGLMGVLDRWVLTKTLENISRVLGDHQQVKININLSGQSLADEGLLTLVEEELARTGVAPARVCFELTETAVISNLAQADHFIQSMKSIGCGFALDDFGSGLSSFSYIKHFPVDYLKIDGSFVRDLIKDPTDRLMVSTINQMGHLLGMKTIAECVEDDSTASELLNIGVDYAQGYAIRRPEPFEPGIVEKFISTNQQAMAA